MHRHISGGIFITLAAVLLAGSVLAQPRGQSDVPELAIEGYSPVSYFEEGRPEVGSPEHSTVYEDRIYYFTSRAQLEKFEADPESYAPLFPNHCPYHLALGRAVAIDPTNYKIADGRLLIFHKSEEMDGLEKWNSHGDEEELIERARGTWKLMDF